MAQQSTIHSRIETENQYFQGSNSFASASEAGRCHVSIISKAKNKLNKAESYNHTGQWKKNHVKCHS
jgi:hypothetical protein